MAGGEILEEMERNIERLGSVSVCGDKNVSFTLTQEENVNSALSAKSKKIIRRSYEMGGNAVGLKQLYEGRIIELEEELQLEKEARMRVERERADCEFQLAELAERLEEAGGVTAVQLQLTRKHDAEVSKLRKEVDESNTEHELLAQSLRRKHQDAVAEMGDQIDHLTKLKAKLEKEKHAMRVDLDDLLAQLDISNKGKASAENMNKQLEASIAKMTVKMNDYTRQINDLSNAKGKIAAELGDCQRALEASEANFQQVNRVKTQLAAQYEEARAQYEEEAKQRNALVTQFRNLQQENDGLHGALKESEEQKAHLQSTVSKLNNDLQAMRMKYEAELTARAEEFEDMKRKLSIQLQETEEAYNGAMAKVSNLEKVRIRMASEIDALAADLDNANATIDGMLKKEKAMQRSIDELNMKLRDVQNELEASQREYKKLHGEHLGLRKAHEDALEAIEAVRRDLKHAQDEVAELSDALRAKDATIADLYKVKQRLEFEKEELHNVIADLEEKFKLETDKVVKLQAEIQNVRVTMEKALRAKEEELDKMRRDLLREMEQIQANLEIEIKLKNDALKIKKKLEMEYKELEYTLETANKTIADYLREIKKLESELGNMQAALDSETAQKEEARNQLTIVQKKLSAAYAELDELRAVLDATTRSKQSLEQELSEVQDRINDLNMQLGSLANAKRKIEGDYASLTSEYEEVMLRLRTQEETLMKAMNDAGRLADELRQEQEHSAMIEGLRKGLECQVRDLQTSLEEAEAIALRSGKKLVAKMEVRIRDLENDLNTEAKRHSETMNNAIRHERRAKELELQTEEDQKNMKRLQEMVEKLSNKVKLYKRKVEEAEEVACVSVGKARRFQQELEEAEERADNAENTVMTLRTRSTRSMSVSRYAGSIRAASIGRDFEEEDDSYSVSGSAYGAAAPYPSGPSVPRAQSSIPTSNYNSSIRATRTADLDDSKSQYSRKSYSGRTDVDSGRSTYRYSPDD